MCMTCVHRLRPYSSFPNIHMYRLHVATCWLSHIIEKHCFIVGLITIVTSLSQILGGVTVLLFGKALLTCAKVYITLLGCAVLANLMLKC